MTGGLYPVCFKCHLIHLIPASQYPQIQVLYMSMGHTKKKKYFTFYNMFSQFWTNKNGKYSQVLATLYFENFCVRIQHSLFKEIVNGLQSYYFSNYIFILKSIWLTQTTYYWCARVPTDITNFYYETQCQPKNFILIFLFRYLALTRYKR